MKKAILSVAGCLLFGMYVFAQSNTYKILLDITSADSSAHQIVARHASGISKSYPEAEVEVVVYGGAIAMVLEEKSTVKSSIQSLTTGAHPVHFKVCGATMKRYNIQPQQLVKGVEIVPDAIIEIVNRQREGWGYIKEAH